MGQLPALYEIAATYRAQAEQLADLDLPAEVIADTLESMAGELEVKSANVIFAARNMETTAAAIKDAESKMAARRKALEARAESLRAYVLNCMQLAGVEKISSPWFTLAQRQNPSRVVIDAIDLVPAEYMRTPPPPPPEPDKNAILASVKAGVEVPGTHIERGVRLDIR